MKTISDNAIILKRINYGEADRILTLLTRSYGKVAVIAKGVRKINSRRKGHLELFNHVSISFTQDGGLGYVTEVETLNVFTDTDMVWEPMGQAYHMCEIVDRLLPDGEEQEYVYRLLLKAIQLLNEEISYDRREEVVRLFEQSLLRQLGYWSSDDTSYERLTPQDKKNFNRAFIEQIIERELRSRLVFGF